MFDVTLTNQSPAELQTSNGKKIGANGGTWTYKGGPQGQTTYIDTPFGRFGFMDIGDQHVPGDSSETWGVLFSFQEMSIVGRYENQGTLNITVDAFLQFQLAGMNFRQVALDGIEIVQPTVAA